MIALPEKRHLCGCLLRSLLSALQQEGVKLVVWQSRANMTSAVAGLL